MVTMILDRHEAARIRQARAAADADRWDHPALSTVSSGYSDLEGRLVTCYSPVRRFTRPKAFAHDLHALSTPLTFALSQDQTLQLMKF